MSSAVASSTCKPATAVTVQPSAADRSSAEPQFARHQDLAPLLLQGNVDRTQQQVVGVAGHYTGERLHAARLTIIAETIVAALSDSATGSINLALILNRLSKFTARPPADPGEIALARNDASVQVLRSGKRRDMLLSAGEVASARQSGRLRYPARPGRHLHDKPLTNWAPLLAECRWFPEPILHQPA